MQGGGFGCSGLHLQACRSSRISSVSPSVNHGARQSRYSQPFLQPEFISLTWPDKGSPAKSLLTTSASTTLPFCTSHYPRATLTLSCFHSQTGRRERKEARAKAEVQQAGVVTGGRTTQESMEGASGGDGEEAVRSRAGEIHLIVGPMFAGKTTALLNKMQAELSAGRSVALVKSDKDTRYGLTAVISHDGMRMPCWAVSNLATFRAEIGEEMYGKLDVIGIDEAQFFQDLYSFCQAAADHEGKTLIVAGLDGDFMRKSFGSALDLIPLADSVVKLSSRCELCGKSAAFSLRKTCDNMTEVIGGSDLYMPVCRQHYMSGQFAVETARTVLEVHRVTQRSRNTEIHVAETAIKT